MDGNVLDMECAMPVATRVAGSGRIAAGKLPATLAAVTTHVGPYDQLGRTWSNLKGVTYLTSQGRKRLYSVGSHVLSLPYERGSKDPSRARLFPRSWATRRKCIVTLVKYVSLNLNEWIVREGLEPAGVPWEVYVTDPGAEPDPSKWRTDLYFPVCR